MGKYILPDELVGIARKFWARADARPTYYVVGLHVSTIQGRVRTQQQSGEVVR